MARRKRARDLELVGMREIAHRLSAAGCPTREQTVRAWRWAGLLPEAAELKAGPVWRWWEIQEWARATGRLDEEQAEQEQAAG